MSVSNHHKLVDQQLVHNSSIIFLIISIGDYDWIESEFYFRHFKNGQNFEWKAAEVN